MFRCVRGCDSAGWAPPVCSDPWRQSILEEPNQPLIVFARVTHPLALTGVL